MYSTLLTYSFRFHLQNRTLSTRAPSDQSVSIFTGVFVIVWLGAAVVTVNAKLLGGAV